MQGGVAYNSLRSKGKFGYAAKTMQIIHLWADDFEVQENFNALKVTQKYFKTGEREI